MFEEVPRTRRGLAGLSARRVAFGPFVIGGGVLVAALGGSVAVAATVLTATTIGTNDVPARRAAAAVVQPARPHTGQSAAPGSAGRRVTSFAIPAPTPSASGPARPAGTPDRSAPQSSAVEAPPVLPTTVPSLSTGPAKPSSTPSPTGPASPTGSPAPSSSGPAGNALVYVTGYDRAANRLKYQFARVQPGVGPGGTDWYSVQSPATFSAAIATHISITSGGRLCPPAGSSCSVAQLIAAAADGFFATAAIDPLGQLDSMIELDNATIGAGINPAPTPTPTPAPTTVAARSPEPAASPAG